MIPSIFISSTIEDLQHLRDAVRDAIVELSYNPVMSEYGEVGYLPTATAQDSCYHTVQQCQLAVILIGKRYGNVSENGYSVTHNEFKTARECRIPIVTLVDTEVMAFKKFYDSNRAEPDLTAPGMDNPKMTCEFIDEISRSQFNNGILTYTHVSEARMHFKRQLAHLFGEFLLGQFDPIKADIRDVLSEVKTLRHEIEAQRSGEKTDMNYLNVIRFLIEDQLSPYRSFIQTVYGGRIDDAIPLLKECNSVDEFVHKKTGSYPETLEVATIEDFNKYRPEFNSDSHATFYGYFPAFQAQGGELGILTYWWSSEHNIVINSYGLAAMNTYHKAFLQAASGVPIDEISQH